MNASAMAKVAETAGDSVMIAASGGAIMDLLVHLDGSAQDERNIVLAETVATAFGAHVRGVFTHEIPSTMLALGPGGEGIAYDFWEADGKAADAAEHQARQRLDRIDATTDFIRTDGMRHELNTGMTTLARSVDLVVVGRPYGQGKGGGEGKSKGWPELLEAAMFGAGTPVLAVPPTVIRPAKMKAILIGWRDTRECARAIAAALPLLQRAERVYLVSVAESKSRDENLREPAADMARHLSRHGVGVEVRHLPEWPDASAGLLNEAVVVDADLIVTGAYWRSRLREFILGGVTRDLLTVSPLPVLMAH